MTAMDSPVVAAIEDLTPAWATAALGCGEAVADSVTVGPVVTGSNVKVRLRIAWRDGLTATPPTSVVVKANFAHRDGDDDIDHSWNRLHRLLNASEARFYAEFAPELDLRMPRCHLAITDPDSGESLLVLEDLVESGHTFGAFDEPFDVDLAANAIEQLAGLHAATWNDPRILGAGLRDAFIESGMLDAFLEPVNWTEQLSRPRGAYVPAALRDREVVDRAVRRVWSLKRTAPLCLVHGDPHIGNYFLTQDGRPGLLDWPLSTLGHWAWDVGYSLASAMTIEDRRTHERDLLAHYLNCLSGLGVTPPDRDAAWLDYRRCSIWGFIAFLTPSSVQTEEYNAVVGERHAVAALDLDALGALGLH